MGFDDLTILFLTANKLPQDWVLFHKEKLLESIEDTKVITISRKPLKWGINLLDTEPQTMSNIYYQMLQGAKLAETPHVAIVEDDTLYPEEHFMFRPPLDTFAYNINRFNLFTWGEPTYFWKDRFSNSTLIAPTQLLIETLEERFAKYPDGTPAGATGEVGRPNIEDKLGVSHRKVMKFETELSVIRVEHEFGVDRLARTHRKGMGPLRAYDVPYWGRAADIKRRFVG